VIKVDKDALKKFIESLTALQVHRRDIRPPGNRKYDDGVFEYSWYQISVEIAECIRWAKQKFFDNPFYGESGTYNGYDDDQGPTDLRDDWPHATPVPGGAWLPVQ